MLKNREEYINALANTPKASIFFQPWWLYAVCNDEWDILFARDKGGNVIGFMPFWKIKKFGQPVIIQPHLTPRLGVKYIYPENLKKEDAKLSFEKKVCDQVIDQIPKNVFFSQMFHLDFNNWLPFYWKGFSQSTRYTYILQNIQDIDYVFHHMKGSVRTDIKKAHPQVELRNSDNIVDHYELVKKSFEKHHQKPPYDELLIKKLDKAIVSHSSRNIIIASKDNVDIASIYVVFDNNSCYLLGIGHDPSIRVKGIIQLLIWESIQIASKKVANFDFEGSMKYNFEKVFRAFGSTQHPYFHIFKYQNEMFRLAHTIMN